MTKQHAGPSMGFYSIAYVNYSNPSNDTQHVHH